MLHSDSLGVLSNTSRLLVPWLNSSGFILGRTGSRSSPPVYPGLRKNDTCGEIFRSNSSTVGRCMLLCHLRFRYCVFQCLSILKDSNVCNFSFFLYCVVIVYWFGCSCKSVLCWLYALRRHYWFFFVTGVSIYYNLFDIYRYYCSNN